MHRKKRLGKCPIPFPSLHFFPPGNFLRPSSSPSAPIVLLITLFGPEWFANFSPTTGKPQITVHPRKCPLWFPVGDSLTSSCHHSLLFTIYVSFLHFRSSFYFILALIVLLNSRAPNVGVPVPPFWSTHRSARLGSYVGARVSFK